MARSDRRGSGRPRGVRWPRRSGSRRPCTAARQRGRSRAPAGSPVGQRRGDAARVARARARRRGCSASRRAPQGSPRLAAAAGPRARLARRVRRSPATAVTGSGRPRSRLRIRRPRAGHDGANLGPGFDCAAVALDLWNELEVDGRRHRRTSRTSAFGPSRSLADPAGLTFRFTDRIPRERGLGSSAAVIALGLVAGAPRPAARPIRSRCSRRACRSRATPTTSPPALAGGVCLTWAGPDRPRRGRRCRGPHRARAGGDERLHGGVAARAARAGGARRRRLQRRARRPARRGARVGLDGALRRGARRPAARAVPPPLLAAVADPRCLPAASARRSPGSGPTVIVWARRDAADACASELAERFAGRDVVRLAVSPRRARKSGVRLEPDPGQVRCTLRPSEWAQSCSASREAEGPAL